MYVTQIYFKLPESLIFNYSYTLCSKVLRLKEIIKTCDGCWIKALTKHNSAKYKLTFHEHPQEPGNIQVLSTNSIKEEGLLHTWNKRCRYLVLTFSMY